MNAKEAQEHLNNIHKTMLERARDYADPGLDASNCVQVTHNHEGTVLFYESAFAVRKEEYVFIITEHHSSIFYHEEEVTIREFKRIWREISDILPWNRKNND